MALLQTLRKTASHGLRAAPRSSALYSTERVFPNFSVYGSDSAFQVAPSAPQYTSAGSYMKTKRVGAIMLSWAKATNSGYNYQNKTFFSLSPTEVGLVLELLDSRIPELSFTHSPNMNASEEDKNSKSLHITRASGSDGNPLVLIKVNHEGESVATLNVGEARVFRELLTYSLPRLYGFHSVLEGPLNVEGGNGGGFSQGGGNSYSSGSNGGYRGGNNKPAGDWPF
ncbi:whirly isoform 1 [Phytophthora cinnamomi]|uniref:whirly isoform 1 n=1 Tax=Phytophthora cinnamomi TaxID=4785 RepID=UPI00355A4BC5|nr:whirly isoform 1 [Phytophthora cinnamomi]